MLVLSPWTKLFILLCSVSFVAFAILIVVCFVSPFCLLHRVLPESARIKYETVETKKQKKQKKKGSDVSDCGELGEPVELTKLNAVPSYYEYGSHLSPFVTATHGGSDGCKSPPPNIVYGHRRLYTVDSSYSSMTPTTETGGSRPTSPTSTINDDASSSTLSSPPSLHSADSTLFGSLSVALQYHTQEGSNLGRLVVTVVDARDLPGREYHPQSCDPFVKIILLKARTRLRRSRSHYMTLSEFQSQTIRRSRCPTYNQSFVVELSKSDVKECALKFLVFDRDKYANPTELGEVLCPLGELKLKDTNEFVQLTLEIGEPKQNNGELLLGLSYLPTSERLSFNIIRAVNLKYENVATNIDNLHLEVRILLIHNGKLVKKKKTTAVSSTNNPNFDAGLSFDLPSSELHHVTFVVGVAHRGDMASESDDGVLQDKPSKHDSFIGKVVLGSNIHSSSSAHHWQAMLHCPRQQVTSWHVLR